MADLILGDRNKRNRSISDSQVARLVSEINGGTFLLTGDTIVFADNMVALAVGPFRVVQNRGDKWPKLLGELDQALLNWMPVSLSCPFCERHSSARQPCKICKGTGMVSRRAYRELNEQMRAEVVLADL